jgi:sn-glycerol 3-phosphate transport system ATP-binding protein
VTTLHVDQVQKSYEGKQVVHGIDLEIEDGEFVVIVGPSGCGKSTLLRMIAGLEDITAGTVAIDGEVMNDIDAADRGCAMVFQNYALYPHMSVRDNIAYPLRIAGLSKAEQHRRVADAAAILDLGDYLNRKPAQLSGGQRQRVAMGRAIVREPKIFLFDEPLSNLDAKLRVQMRLEIRRLHKRLGATSIFVTHDQVEAMTLADKLVVMNGGRIEQVGKPSDVYANPASTFVAEFLGAPAMNLLVAHEVTPGTLTLDAAPGHRLPPGLGRSAVTIGIRPEDVVLGDPAGILVEIDLIEELGGSRIAYARLNSVEIAAIIPRTSGATEGDTVTVGLPPAALHFFDSQTGARLSHLAPL